MADKPQTPSELLQASVVRAPSSVGPSVVAPVAGLIAAWIAAGSVGLLGHPLRHALVLFSLAFAVLAAWPRTFRDLLRTAVWIVCLVAAVAMTASSLSPVNVLAAAVALAAIAAVRPEDARGLRIAALAVALFGVYRVANTSIPTLWLLTDRLGGGLGELADRLTGQRLNVGATFGGVDFLLVMTAIYALSLVEARGNRLRLAVWGAAGIVAAQLVYLAILSEAPRLLDYLTAKPADDEWFRRWIADFVPWKDLLPWNLPALAVVAQGAVAAAIFGNLARSPGVATPGLEPTQRSRLSFILTVLTTAAAALLPIATVHWLHHPTLTGKKVVTYEKGLLNWLKPVHGEYGRLMIGMYGMFGQFVESLGGKYTQSPDLADKDLEDAQLLVLFYPTHELDPDQLSRVRHYVERGGHLLLMCDHTGREQIGKDPYQLRDSRFNDLLSSGTDPPSIRVAFDAAEFAVGGFLQSYEALGHPTTAGIGDDRNLFGVVIGASLEVESPARPILIGRWGYSDVGDSGGSAMLGNHRYDPGEKLGDLILAAEQPWGNGRVLVFGDTSSFVNGIVPGTHDFVSRLLAYMSEDVETPQSPVRQTIGVALALVVALSLLALRPTACRAAAVAIALSISLSICVSVTTAAMQQLPSGRQHTPNNLAYFDAAHLGSYSEESTRPDGTFGIEYTLMRNGYLVLAMHDELTYNRLKEAGLLVSMGPERPFTLAERQAIKRFVKEGGIFIIMVGHERAAASRALLADFEFSLDGPPPGTPSDTEPAPLGHFKAAYFTVPDQYEADVRFHAAWPVICDDSRAEVLVSGRANRSFDPEAGGFHMDGPINAPVIVRRAVGKGQVVVIGDTDFATSKNLEHEDGTPFDGLRENADFWRWLIPKLNGAPAWIPPKREPETAPTSPLPVITPPPAAAAPAPESPVPAPTPPPPAADAKPREPSPSPSDAKPAPPTGKDAKQKSAGDAVPEKKTEATDKKPEAKP